MACGCNCHLPHKELEEGPPLDCQPKNSQERHWEIQLLLHCFIGGSASFSSVTIRDQNSCQVGAYNCRSCLRVMLIECTFEVYKILFICKNNVLSAFPLFAMVTVLKYLIEMKYFKINEDLKIEKNHNCFF